MSEVESLIVFAASMFGFILLGRVALQIAIDEYHRHDVRYWGPHANQAGWLSIDEVCALE